MEDLGPCYKAGHFIMDFCGNMTLVSFMLCYLNTVNIICILLCNLCIFILVFKAKRIPLDYM